MRPVRFIHAMDDWLSPIILKELRQAVRSRFLRIGFGLLALADLVALAAFLRYTDTLAANVWGFRLTQTVMLGLCLTMIPPYTAMRWWPECSERADELMLLSGLRPHWLIFCKLLTAAILFCGICLVSAPVLTLVHCLCGVGVTTILDMLVLDFTLTLACTQALILLITVRDKGPVNVFFVATGLLILLPCAYLLGGEGQQRFKAACDPSYSGWHSCDDDALRNREAESLLWLTPAFAWSGVLLGLRSPERTSPRRLAALLAWLGLISAAYVAAGPEPWSYRHLVDGNISLWGWVNVGSFCLTVLVAISQLQASRWQRYSGSGLSRHAASTMSSRWAPCLIYTLVGVGLSAMVAFWHLSGWLYPSWHDDWPGRFVAGGGFSHTGWPLAIGFGLWAMCYGVSAGIAGGIFLGDTVTSKLTRVRASVLTVLAAIMPLAVRLLLEAKFPGFARDVHGGGLIGCKDPAVVLIADKPWGFALVAVASPWFFARKSHTLSPAGDNARSFHRRDEAVGTLGCTSTTPFRRTLPRDA